MEMCGHRHAPSALPPGKNPATHWIGWVGPRAGLCVGGKENNLLSTAWFEARTVQPVAWSLYRLHYPASVVYVQYEICTHVYSLTIYMKIIVSYCLVIRSGDRIPVGARFFAHVQTGPEAHPVSCTMGTGSFPGVKRPGRGADHPPPSSTEVKKE
jgi:hypothetical protein